MVFFVASDRFDDAAVAKSRGVGAMVLRARARDCRTGNLMGIFGSSWFLDLIVSMDNG